MSSRTDDVTHILGTLDDAERASLEQLLPVVYDELRSLAEAYLRQERRDHTLQATALVHEAYVRLAGSAGPWNDRGHFFRAAAKTMRHILVNHAVGRKRLKRGSAWRRVELEEATIALPGTDVDLAELDEALERLASIDPGMASVVELRFFGGCTSEEAAEAMGASSRTIERDWRLARAWLRSELGGETEDDERGTRHVG